MSKIEQMEDLQGCHAPTIGEFTVDKTGCVSCHSLIHGAIVKPVESAFQQVV